MNNEKIKRLLLLLFISSIFVIQPILVRFHFFDTNLILNLFGISLYDKPMLTSYYRILGKLIYKIFMLVSLIGNVLFYYSLALLTKEVFSKK